LLLGIGASILAGLPLTYFVLLAIYVNEDASCANCRTFTWHVCLRPYADAHDGWFPRGGSDLLDTLGLSVQDCDCVHFFTSHNGSMKAEEHWRFSGTLSEETCLYRYNEGLRLDDPHRMILLYSREPTRWANSYRKEDEPGRASLTLTGFWEWMPEAEFQQRQAATLAFLEGRQAELRASRALADRVRLVLEAIEAGPAEWLCRVHLENRGAEAVTLRVLQPLTLLGIGGQLDPGDAEISLHPGAAYPFTGTLAIKAMGWKYGDEIYNSWLVPVDAPEKRPDAAWTPPDQVQVNAVAPYACWWVRAEALVTVSQGPGASVRWYLVSEPVRIPEEAVPP
jgi:hypothetical protein